MVMRGINSGTHYSNLLHLTTEFDNIITKSAVTNNSDVVGSVLTNQRLLVVYSQKAGPLSGTAR